MENKIFAPWRMAYILSNSDDNEQKEPGCIFCEFPRMNDDEKNLIIHRGKECFVILNAFPYNPGHLMVVPYRHTADISLPQYALLASLFWLRTDPSNDIPAKSPLDIE